MVTLLLALQIAAGCGGRVTQGPGGQTTHGTRMDDGGATSPDGSTEPEDAGFPESCAALADCCGEFTGSAAASCNAVAVKNDQDECAQQVTTYQSVGDCIGQ